MFIYVIYVYICNMYKHMLHVCIIIIHVYNILKMNDFILKINDFFKKKQKLATVHAAYPHNTRIGDTLARAYIQSWNCIFFLKYAFVWY